MKMALGKTMVGPAPLVLYVLIVGIAFVFGVHQGKDARWPTLQMEYIKDQITNKPDQFDRFGRLVAFPNKQEVQCPAQTPQTAVLFVFGQSNSANHLGQRYRAIDDRVLNFFNGKCYLAESPLLGASGEMGEVWTLLGNKLVETGQFQRVIIVSSGIGGTPISRWAIGGDLNRMLIDVISDLSGHYNITHVLWHQGEADFQNGTNKKDYEAGFRSIVATLDALKVRAPIYVSKASYIPVDRMPPRLANLHKWQMDNQITEAQQEIPDGKTIFAGVNTDAEVAPLDRFDGQHLSGSGQEITATRWVEILNAGHAVSSR